jgi:hypothetical protein
MKHKEIVSAVNEILEQYNIALTLRQIFYRLVAKQLIPNTVTSYKTLSKILVRARERGEVDEYKIEDRSRQVLGVGDYRAYKDFDEFIQSYIDYLKSAWQYWARPVWETQNKKVMLAIEKDALSRLFVDVAEQYNIQVFPTRGYSSYTYVREIAGRIYRSDKKTVILYFGDYDPSGRDIERDLRDRLILYTGGKNNFELVRIALTREQIHQYNLPPRPEDIETLEKLKRDPRAKQYGLDYAAELDALEPPILQDLIKKAIDEQINREAWNARVQQIKSEQEELKERLAKIKIEWQ